MIGKAKSNVSLSKTFSYNTKKGSILLEAFNLEGETAKDFQGQMSDLQKCYTGPGKCLTFHVQLSPAIEDGKKLKEKDWKKMAKLFLEKMNLQKHQAVVFLHHDKEHCHAHLIINRVNEETFKLCDDSFIGKKASKSADEIAIEMGLVRAMKIFNQREKISRDFMALNSPEKLVGSKQKFKAFLENILSKSPKNLEGYFNAIKENGYTLRQHKDKETGALCGYGIALNGTYMDASEIGKKFTIKNLVFGEKIKPENSKQIIFKTSPIEIVQMESEKNLSEKNAIKIRTQKISSARKVRL